MTDEKDRIARFCTDVDMDPGTLERKLGYHGLTVCTKEQLLLIIRATTILKNYGLTDSLARSTAIGILEGKQ